MGAAGWAAAPRRYTTSSESDGAADWAIAVDRAAKTRQDVAKRADKALLRSHYIHFGTSSAGRAGLFDLLEVDAPEILLAQVREPHRSVGRADRIPASPRELPDHRVGRGVDLRNRHLEHRGPHVALAEPQFAAAAGNARFDIGRQFPRLGIDARHRAVALI